MSLSLALIMDAASERADAHCVTDAKLKTLGIGNDRFTNFDMQSHHTGRCNVDWPINFLFKKNATAPKVKQGLRSVGYTVEGSTMYMAVLENNYNWTWDSDEGVKNDPAGCFTGDMEHVRIYGSIYSWESGAAANRMYDLGWGYYVLGTSHIDHRECTGGWAGMSETAEDRIAGDARRVSGWGAANNDQGNFSNHLEFEVASDGHRLENSGRATYVNVP